MARDKVLVIVNKGSTHGVTTQVEQDVFATLFGVNRGDQSIMHDLSWHTKYYDARYDLYIDTHNDSLQQWMLEFNDEQCTELRGALAGVVILHSQYDESVAQMLDTQGIFAIWMNDSEETDQDAIDDINMELAAGDSSLEVVRLDNDNRNNDFGEAVGLARAREIIDTYPWEGMTQHKEPDTSQTPKEQDMEAIVSLLNNARQRYSSLQNSDSTEAKEFAEGMADELARKLGV